MASPRNSDVLVVAPRLTFTKRPCGVLIRNGELGSELEAPLEVVEVLKLFRKPQRIEALKKADRRLPDDVLALLVSRFLLVPIELRDVLRHGAIRASDELPVGHFSTVSGLLDPKSQAKAARRFAVMGACVDVGARGEGGARHGPDAIRKAFPLRLARSKPKAKLPTVYDLEFHRRIDLGTLELRDLGNVHYVTGESNEAFGERLEWFARQATDGGYCVLGLGGDHSISRSLLRPVLARRQPFGIVHFDAHTDLYDVPRGVHTHGNPFDEVLSSTSLQSFFQVGTRQLRVDRGTPVVDGRLFAASARDVARLTPEVLFASLNRELPYYLTFDVDCMSPTECPETGTPVPGGLTYYQALELFDWLTRHVKIIGADFVEVTGPVTRRNQAAQVTANLLSRLILSAGTDAPLESQLFRAPPAEAFAFDR